MRISTSILTDNRIIDVGGAAERFADVQTKLGTGKQINKPSDDPSGTGQVIDLRSVQASIEQFRKNGQYAKGFIGASDMALQQAANLLRQARQYAVQGANDTLDISAREGLAMQVREIVSQVAAVANTKYGSRYLFSGQQVSQQAYVLSGGVYTYRGGTTANGDANLTVEIAPGDNVVTNSTGDTVFKGALTALTDLQSNLDSAQSRAVSDNDITAIDDALATISSARADFGSKVQRVDQVDLRLQQNSLDLSTYISNIQDADIPNTVVQLKSAETAYQSALAATAHGFQQSLLDFLK